MWHHYSADDLTPVEAGYISPAGPVITLNPSWFWGRNGGLPSSAKVCQVQGATEIVDFSNKNNNVLESKIKFIISAKKWMLEAQMICLEATFDLFECNFFFTSSCGDNSFLFYRCPTGRWCHLGRW